MRHRRSLRFRRVRRWALLFYRKLETGRPVPTIPGTDTLQRISFASKDVPHSLSQTFLVRVWLECISSSQSISAFIESDKYLRVLGSVRAYLWCETLNSLGGSGAESCCIWVQPLGGTKYLIFGMAPVSLGRVAASAEAPLKPVISLMRRCTPSPTQARTG